MTDQPLVDLISSKQNLERILDNLKEGIIAHNLQRQIFYFNSEAERITGWDRKDVIGKDCHEIFGAPLCGERCSFCKNSEILQDSKAYTINIITKSGVPRRIEMSQTMMKDGHGEFIGVLASLEDITEITALKKQSKEIYSFSNIIGRDNKMLTVFQQISDVADYDFPVHIFGETGTGKELVAAAIHNESQRGGGPFVPINCGALPEGLIESELFGHVKGAFSGAIRDKKGRFELATGGTVFLDEVAELTKPLQVKLLRFLQEGTFEKVGGEKTITVNVRVISATNRNLKKEVKKNNFREDLYYRLNVIPINIPPIRERKTDIPLLIEHFLRQTKNHGKTAIEKFSDDALAQMMDYSWPGNVRELQNAVQFAIVRCGGSIVTTDDLPLELRNMQCYPVRRGPSRKLDTDKVKDALIKTGGNKAKAAKVLGVGRATLYRFLGDHPELGQVGG